MEHIDNNGLRQLLETKENLCLLDVRTPEEWHYLGHLPGATLISMQEIPVRKGELDPQAKTVVICQHGQRSFDVAYYLEQAGFKNILNFAHGMAEWDGELVQNAPKS